MNNAPSTNPIHTTNDQGEPASDEPDGGQASPSTYGKCRTSSTPTTLFQLLLALLLTSGALWAKVPQPILITRGTILGGGTGPGNGNGRNTVSVSGHCGYFSGEGGPKAGNTHGVLGGKVQVKLSNGPTSHTTLEAAMQKGWVQYEGADYRPNQRPIFKVRFKLHPNVESIQFLTHAALVDDSVAFDALTPIQRQDVVDQCLQDFDPSHHPARVQADIWQNRMGLIASRDEKQDSVTIRSASLDPDDHMSVEFLRMPTQAGASVIRTPGGRILVHDAGGPLETFLKEFNALPRTNGKHRISILITHTDLDHYSALLKALESGALEEHNIEIQELIIGCDPQALAEGTSNPRLARLIKALEQHKFIPDKTQKDFAHFVLVDGPRSPLKPRFNTPPEPGAPLLYWLEPEPGFRVLLSRLGNPPVGSKDRHINNLAAFYSHNGSGIWSLGDASVQQLSEMIEPSIVNPDIWLPKPGVPRARCILWPHHAWRPTQEADRQKMKNFLKAMRTEAVFVGMSSKPNADALRRFEDIKTLVGEVEQELLAEGIKLPIQVHTTSDARLLFQAFLYLLRRDAANG